VTTDKVVLAHTIAYLERCLTVLSEVAMSSSDITFLRTFLTHATGYLSGDLSPDTEAMENWHTPENQAMIRRYITHVEAEIRLGIEAWQQAHPGEMHTAAGIKLQNIVTGLDRLRYTPPNDTDKPATLESNDI
jgi:hypothetical protein